MRHGIASYRLGCRCGKCRRAKAKYDRAYRAAQAVANARRCECGCGRKTKGGRFCPGHDLPRVWNEALVIEAIRRWNSETGEPPTANEWRGGHSRNAVVWPTQTTVRRLFGRWNAALAAAGLQPRAARPRVSGRGSRPAKG